MSHIYAGLDSETNRTHNHRLTHTPDAATIVYNTYNNGYEQE